MTGGRVDATTTFAPYSVYVNGNAVISGGSINASGDSTGLNVVGACTISDAVVGARGGTYGIYAGRELIINSGTVTTTGTIYSYYEDITINGGTVLVATGNIRTRAAGKNVTVNGGTVTVTTGNLLSDRGVVEMNGGTITAGGQTFRAVLYDLSGGTGTVPVESNKRSGDTFTAASASGFTAPTGYPFVQWNTAQNGTGIAYAPGATITMPATPLTLYAIWEGLTVPTYLVTVTDGSGGGDYAAGVNVHINSDIPPPGQKFKEWVITPSVTFTTGSAATPNAAFIMPAQAVTVNAIYEPIPAGNNLITVSSTGNGVANASVQSAPPGTVITLSATPDSGNTFTRWEVISGGITLSSIVDTTVIFTMPDSAVSINAVFVVQNRAPQFTITQPPITNAQTDARFVIDGNYVDLDGVSINDRALDLNWVNNDTKVELSGWPGYTGIIGEAVNGSVIITLYKEFLATLPNGTYTLTVSFKGAGDTVPYASPFTTFVLNRTTSAISPKTGDDTYITGWIIVLVFSALGITSVITWRIRRQLIDKHIC